MTESPSDDPPGSRKLDASDKPRWPCPGAQYTVLDAFSMFEQYRAAERWWREQHAKLIAEGYTWDGQDGYLKEVP